MVGVGECVNCPGMKAGDQPTPVACERSTWLPTGNYVAVYSMGIEKKKILLLVFKRYSFLTQRFPVWLHVYSSRVKLKHVFFNWKMLNLKECTTFMIEDSGKVAPLRKSWIYSFGWEENTSNIVWNLKYPAPLLMIGGTAWTVIAGGCNCSANTVN